jgi:hypothetical protein
MDISNGSTESILDAYFFFKLDQVRTLTEEWMEEYNPEDLICIFEI